MSVLKRFLVVDSQGGVRVTLRQPRLAMDEIAVPVVIHMPEGWGRIVRDQIDVVMPDPPTIGPVGEPIVAGDVS